MRLPPSAIKVIEECLAAGRVCKVGMVGDKRVAVQSQPASTIKFEPPIPICLARDNTPVVVQLRQFQAEGEYITLVEHRLQDDTGLWYLGLELTNGKEIGPAYPTVTFPDEER
jgi:hypothetical protein